MEFRIADTFTDSLARLTSEEQKAVKTTAFDLQVNPSQPGLQFHKLDKPRDSNFLSVRVNKDIRLIIHRTGESLLLCYVDHHDKAYQWAERRRLETHPKTGAAQLVEIRETIREIMVPRYVDDDPDSPHVRSTFGLTAPANPPLFESLSDDQLLGYGVPVEWLADVRRATEDTLLLLTDHLPSEAAEALLEIAVGGTPEIAQRFAARTDPFTHPDAQRRFRIMHNVEELERALEYPWERWTVFLHPAQRDLVERDYGGPARVSGSAGTGKTVVALHRAVFLARKHPDARILLTTFSETLANALRAKLRRLIHNEPRLGERIDVWSFDGIARRIFGSHAADPKIVSSQQLRNFLSEASAEVAEHKFSQRFIVNEWHDVVDAWQIESWEAYRDVRRLGRKTRLPEEQRAVLWSIFENIRKKLLSRDLVTYPQFFKLLTGIVSTNTPVFDFVVVDEAQDLGIPHLRFFAALAGSRPNGLFFAGDLGQRIFQQPFSWKALGVDVRGRSRTLRVNYRTSHQIRMQADRLLGPEMADVDGNSDDRKGTISVFNGPLPVVTICKNAQEEIAVAGGWIAGLASDGLLPHELAVFVRSDAELDRAMSAMKAAGLPFTVLDSTVETRSGHVSIGTMHLAKGLEFRAVVAMACDDEVIPSQERVESVSDDSELQDVYNTERHLLYVACTRARDHLLVSAVTPGSEFLKDLIESR